MTAGADALPCSGSGCSNSDCRSSAAAAAAAAAAGCGSPSIAALPTATGGGDRWPAWLGETPFAARGGEKAEPNKLPMICGGETGAIAAPAPGEGFTEGENLPSFVGGADGDASPRLLSEWVELSDTPRLNSGLGL